MKTKHSSLHMEPLEDRALAATGLLSSAHGIAGKPIPQPQLPHITAIQRLGVLQVNGTYLNDAITVRQSNGSITVDGVAGKFSAATIGAIVVNGKGGNDVIRLNSETQPGGQPIVKPCIVHGGDGNDAIFGSYGNDSLFGDAGNDFILGNRGSDLVVGGAGMDALYGGAGNDRLIADTADSIAAGQAGTDVVDFQRVDPAVLANYDPATMKAALQYGLGGYSLSQSQAGGKIIVDHIAVQNVTIENGTTTVFLSARIRYKKTTGFPQFSVSGSIHFSVQPQLTARFVEGNLQSASIALANPQVQDLSIDYVPSWLSNASEVHDFLESKLAAQPPIAVTALLQTFLAMGGSLGPTIGV